jgi:hypothetical protein
MEQPAYRTRNQFHVHAFTASPAINHNLPTAEDHILHHGGVRFLKTRDEQSNVYNPIRD